MLEPILYRSEEAAFDAAGLAKVEVQATIVNHLRGPKLRVFKFKPKRGYRRRTGHRQELTRIEVTKIGPRGRSRTGALGRRQGGRRWRIRRASARAVTDATRTRSGLASRRSRVRP